MGSLIDEFRQTTDIKVSSEALEKAFILPIVDRKDRKISLKNTHRYGKPTHTVQRASKSLNEQIDIIDKNTLILNTKKAIIS
jgi:hypothetical protein